MQAIASQTSIGVHPKGDLSFGQAKNDIYDQVQ
jgi:hypothetical protein